MTVNELYFTPLGGAGEIGMNMSLYGYEGEWLMVDMGIGFADSAANGVDVFTPDPSFIIEERDRLVGLVITHAHEDHLGGIPYLWDKIRCPIYATPFAMSLLRRKLDDVGLLKQVNLYEIPVGGMSTIGKFSVDFISAAHSVPEGNILAIRCAAGVVVHATDWKIDPNPLVGRQTDEKALRQVGDEGVLALVCDSTNVFVEGESGSEGLLRQSLKKIIANCTGRVAVACFASNIARLETINRVANETGRHAALVGRSLWRNTEISIENGYLQGIEPFVSEEEISFFPANKILLGVTGSQGEPRSALTRIARGKHRNVSLQAGDTVIFSSREIPGNELAIANVQNRLVRQGVNVLTEQDGLVHVSDISWKQRQAKPSEVASKGDEIEVKVLNIDVEQERLSLGIKQLTEDPWKDLDEKNPLGTVIKGTIVNLTDFGIFVEVSDGVEGLVHISEIDSKIPKNKVHEMYPIGSVVKANVIKIDLDERRLGLSITEVISKPPPVSKTEDDKNDTEVSIKEKEEKIVDGNFSEKQIVHDENNEESAKLKNLDEELKTNDSSKSGYNSTESVEISVKKNEIENRKTKDISTSDGENLKEDFKDELIIDNEEEVSNKIKLEKTEKTTVQAEKSVKVNKKVDDQEIVDNENKDLKTSKEEDEKIKSESNNKKSDKDTKPTEKTSVTSKTKKQEA